jgi:predicted DCC family thiol-disulfide oxidoreductase YuxK
VNTMAPPSTAVIVFDGDCVFCQRSVRFIHRHDRALVFRFAARQSPAGQRLLADAGVHVAPNSMVLLDDRGAWLRSDAVLRIAANLDTPWSLARVFLVVPRVVRDGVYRVVAAVRHRISRRLPACERPDASLRARLLE